MNSIEVEDSPSKMDLFFRGAAAVVILAALSFVSALLSTAVGAFAGWAVSLTPFGKWIQHVLSSPPYTLAELGALLGFAGSFLRYPRRTRALRRTESVFKQSLNNWQN